MIIIDEPSPAKRLIVGALKMSKSSLQKISEEKSKLVRRGSLLTLITFIAINFFFMNGLFSKEQVVLAKEAEEKVEEKEVENQIDFSEIMDKNPEEVIQDIIDEAEERIKAEEEEKKRIVAEALEQERQRVLAEQLAVMLEGHPMAEMADEISIKESKPVGYGIILKDIRIEHPKEYYYYKDNYHNLFFRVVIKADDMVKFEKFD